VAEAQAIVGVLKEEQARGNFAVAEYYEKNKHYAAARIYYNEVVSDLRLAAPDSPLAEQARKRIDAINARHPGS
jgi:hypothetical protein